MDTLAAYYRMADLALVSSVYDGMNLVAKGIRGQPVDEGACCWSHMAGAARKMTDALVINPTTRKVWPTRFDGRWKCPGTTPRSDASDTGLPGGARYSNLGGRLLARCGNPFPS